MRMLHQVRGTLGDVGSPDQPRRGGRNVATDEEIGRAVTDLADKATEVERCGRDLAEDPGDDSLRAAFDAAWRAYELAHQRCLRLPPLRGIESEPWEPARDRGVAPEAP
jgi:hypothetical protein